jgi:hypothetical protein
MNFLPHTRKNNYVVKLSSPAGTPERFHAFDEQSIGAVNAALAAQ